MRYMFTMMNNARLSVGLEGLALAERAYQQARRLRQGAHARAGRRARRPASSRSIIEHPDVRRMLLTHAGATSRRMRGLIYANAAAIDRRRARTPTRPTAPRPHGAGRPAHAGVEGLGHRPRRRAHVARHPGPRRHGLHRGDRRRPALPRRPHRRRSTRAPTASRPWTSSAASCRCGPAARSTDYLGYIDATLDASSATAGDDLASIRARAGRRRSARLRDGHRLAARQRRRPTRSTRWPAPRPYLRLFGLVTGGWVMAQQALAATRPSPTPAPADKAFYEGKVAHRPLLLRAAPAAGAGLVPAVTGDEPRPGRRGALAAGLGRGRRGSSAVPRLASAGGSAWRAGQRADGPLGGERQQVARRRRRWSTPARGRSAAGTRTARGTPGQPPRDLGVVVGTGLVARTRRRRAARVGGAPQEDVEVEVARTRPSPLDVEQGGDLALVPQHVLEGDVAVDERRWRRTARAPARVRDQVQRLGEQHRVDVLELRGASSAATTGAVGSAAPTSSSCGACSIGGRSGRRRGAVQRREPLGQLVRRPGTAPRR